LNATQPVYAGGRLSANIDAAKARKEAALLGYRQTVLRAFEEVEDALTLQASERSRQAALQAQVADNRRAVSESEARYRRGQVSLLAVLDSQRDLLASEDAQAGSALAACLSAIGLYKALGGGWESVGPRPDGVARE
jgi:multidrug efflux system outer membrane protein